MSGSGRILVVWMLDLMPLLLLVGNFYESLLILFRHLSPGFASELAELVLLAFSCVVVGGPLLRDPPRTEDYEGVARSWDIPRFASTTVAFLVPSCRGRRYGEGFGSVFE